jgi:hypothetical protein
MQHYDVTEVEGWAVDAGRLVDQANAAEEAQRRYERALAQVLAGAVMDLTEGDRGI